MLHILQKDSLNLVSKQHRKENKMDYKEKYEQALENLKTIKAANKNNKGLVNFIERKYPELKESEDERIRKELISFVLGQIRCHDKPNAKRDEMFESWIVWLEKQGKQEQLYIRFGEIPSNEKSKIYQGEIEVGTENGVSVYPAFKTDEGDIILGLNLPITKTTLYTQQHLLEYDNRSCYLVKGDYVGKDTDGQPLINNISIVEKINDYRVKEEQQNKQKPTDKVEPKFKVGDWVVVDDGRTGRIIACTKDFVDVELEFSCLSTRVNNIRSWTIQDAKHGDVLVNGTIVLIVDHLGTFENNPIIYSWYFADSKKFYGMGTSKPDRWDVKGFTPATKEQRDLLFQKMKEAGYEWDSEKKELKEIEQKSAFGEEGEKIRKELYRYFRDLQLSNDREFSPSISIDEILTWVEKQKDHVEELERAYKCADEVQYRKGFEDGVASVKPTEWSEEDERMCQNLLECMRSGWRKLPTDILKYESWIKSLKERMKGK